MLDVVMTVCAVGFFAAPFILYAVVPKPQEAVRDERLSIQIDNSRTTLTEGLSNHQLDYVALQLDALDERIIVLERMIQQRFADTELTAIRYRMIAEEVQLGIYSNIQRIYEYAQARALIEGDAAREKTLTPDQESRCSLLTEKIERMANGNEAALSALTNAVTEVVKIDTETRPTSNELENWVAELERAVSIAHRMSVTEPSPDQSLVTGTVSKPKPKITPGAH